MFSINYSSGTDRDTKKTRPLLLTPFSDENNYLCVGGRLKHANIPTNSKNQIILSKDHYLSRLSIKESHEQNVHVGRKHTLALLRKHFLIAASGGLIKKAWSECLLPWTICKTEHSLYGKPTKRKTLWQCKTFLFNRHWTFWSDKS